MITEYKVKNSQEWHVLNLKVDVNNLCDGPEYYCKLPSDTHGQEPENHFG